MFTTAFIHRENRLFGVWRNLLTQSKSNILVVEPFTVYLKSLIQKIWEDAKNQFKDNTPNMFWSNLTNAVVVNYNGFSMNLLFMKYRFAYILSRMKTPYYTLPPTKWKFLKSGVVWICFNLTHVWEERANKSTC